MPEKVFVKDNLGCVGHPNVHGHKVLADGIYNSVRKILE